MAHVGGALDFSEVHPHVTVNWASEVHPHITVNWAFDFLSILLYQWYAYPRVAGCERQKRARGRDPGASLCTIRWQLSSKCKAVER